jgi:hypothetical protein
MLTAKTWNKRTACEYCSRVVSFRTVRFRRKPGSLVSTFKIRAFTIASRAPLFDFMLPGRTEFGWARGEVDELAVD